MAEQSGSSTSGSHPKLNGNGGSRGSSAKESELTHRMEEGLEELRERAGQLGERASHMIQKNPLVAIVGAAAVGFLFARLISRR